MLHFSFHHSTCSLNALNFQLHGSLSLPFQITVPFDDIKLQTEGSTSYESVAFNIVRCLSMIVLHVYKISTNTRMYFNNSTEVYKFLQLKT